MASSPRIESMATYTWDTRELPILDAVAVAEEAGKAIGWGNVAETTGIEAEIVRRSLESLLSADYISGMAYHEGGGSFEIANIRLTERGRRAVGQWPSGDPFVALTALLEHRIATESDPARRSKLQRFLDAMTDVGKDVTGGVLVALVRQLAGL